MILPAIQVTLYAAIVGGDMKDVKLLKTNDDNCEYLNATYYLENTYYTVIILKVYMIYMWPQF